MISKTDKNYKRIVTYSYEVEAEDLDTSGYGEISNTGSLGAFTGATVPALANATYDIDITVDGTIRKLAVALLITDDWDGICTKIETALQTATSSTETVAIADGKIKVTSATEGASSTILIEAGTTGSGGGDLITAITAIGATYTATIDTPVDGTEGQVTIPLASEGGNYDEFLFTSLLVTTSSDVQKTGLKIWYDQDSDGNDFAYISDNGSTSEIASGDRITFTGFYLNQD